MKITKKEDMETVQISFARIMRRRDYFSEEKDRISSLPLSVNFLIVRQSCIQVHRAEKLKFLTRRNMF